MKEHEHPYWMPITTEGKMIPHKSQGVIGMENKRIEKKFETEAQRKAFEKKHEGNYEFHRHSYLEPYEIKNKKAAEIARKIKEQQK